MGMVSWKEGDGSKGEDQRAPILQTVLAIAICVSGSRDLVNGNGACSFPHMRDKTLVTLLHSFINS